MFHISQKDDSFNYIFRFPLVEQELLLLIADCAGTMRGNWRKTRLPRALDARTVTGHSWNALQLGCPSHKLQHYYSSEEAGPKQSHESVKKPFSPPSLKAKSPATIKVLSKSATDEYKFQSFAIELVIVPSHNCKSRSFKDQGGSHNSIRMYYR